ncbi:hypothetical protein PLESTB_000260200 [Pleodorina starrii]|uniref:pantothenate kinase n=1 Tax=Pleodorina starrii TaxID=330485 RepID=A0A9W6EYT5_9CHLO|nr:hypothetical protein PLESTM_001011100 [Pleodorina starrii]GLC49575.1 hypothetical protein PLESTB_000260200 [Pleodorina starrii]GLC77264.1 hypothetical protein PLESTF_001906500 [Pleodorina starrii]
MDSELDFTGASIEERAADDNSGGIGRHSRRYQPPPAPSIQLPNQDAEYVNHIAIDIGGSLIKLVYFSPDPVDSGSSGEGETPSCSPPGAPGTLAHATSRSPQQNSQRGGKLHFVKFETSRVEDVIDFIEAKGLHRYCGRNGTKEMRVKATGGGAYKYSEAFKERLGVVLEKEDEMACLVSGCNFLLKAIHHEAFIYEAGATTFVPTNEDSDLYPYLLVNIGSGVSMVKVSGDNQFERVSGSSIGGGTYWGLCRLLTQLTNFDEMLDLSVQGDNSSVDMLVGDIYGGRDYASIGLSATTIASSFGKVVSQDKALSDYAPADMCLALCRMVAYNIGQLAHMNAVRHGIKRIFFGGFFIRGHPYTMDTISYAIRFWSKGEMAAMFLRHEGFLGAVGAFLTVHPMPVSSSRASGGGAASEAQQARKVRARFVERFPTGAPLTGGEVVGPAIRDVSEKVSWVEKFVAAAASSSASPTPPTSGSEAVGPSPSAPSRAEAAGKGAGAGEAAGEGSRPPRLSDGGGGGGIPTGAAGAPSPLVGRTLSLTDQPLPWGRGRMSLHVGVLHYSPTLEPFPLLASAATYEPNTLDINSDEEELRWWVRLLREQIPVVVEKASASEGGGELPQRRAQAFGRAFGAHLERLAAEPGCYGALGLAELFAMREECLREFGFGDVYRLDKQRENSAALAVLPDLLRELDGEEPLPSRLRSLVEGVLAGNIFDWGSQACVALYRDGTILDIYRDARLRLSKRPWAVDNFDAFAARIMDAISSGPAGEREQQGGQQREQQQREDQASVQPEEGGSDSAGPSRAPTPPPPYRRVMMFVDNSGADVVLGMLPFARELLRLGCEVVLVANSLPAINDITAPELRALLSAAATVCPIIKAAREAAIKVEMATGGHVPPYPGLRPVRRSSSNLQPLLQQQQQSQQQQHLSPPPPQQHQLDAARHADGTSDVDGGASTSNSSAVPASPQGAQQAAARREGAPPAQAAAGTDRGDPGPSVAGAAADLPASASPTGSAPLSPVALAPEGPPAPRPATAAEARAATPTAGGAALSPSPPPAWHAVATDPLVNRLCPKLYVVSNGQGSPCLDLRRVPDRLAEACVGVDLLVIEGMGRAIHTNFTAKFSCDVLKLAMIKTERLAKKLFNGNLYDCICIFDPAER